MTTYVLRDGNIYNLSSNQIIKKNITKVCGIVDIKSNVIYGYNKKKHPKKKCYIDYGFGKHIVAFVPIQQFTYLKNIYVSMNFSNEFSLCDVIGNVGNYEAEKQYLKLKCISNWESNKKFKINNRLLNEKENTNRIDFTTKKIYSIDPPNCKDIDDAIHIEKIEENIYEIGIHIADVSYVIEEKSNLDNEISKRGKTIYFKDETMDMIPYDIMKDISLIKNKLRNAFSVIFKINSNSGEIINYYYCKSLIINNENLSYNEAQQIINKKTNMDLYNLFMIGQKIHNRMYVDDNLHDNIILKQQYDVHTMIEIYMIITNMTVAETIVKNCPKKAILRTQNKNNKIIKLSHDFFDHKYYERYLLLNKNKANYVVGMTDIGHDDLKITYYTHFTSPLRRYIDIINHRLLYNIINNKKEKNDEIYENNYLDICMQYYNELYKWYNYHERYYKNIEQIYEIYENKNNIKVDGTIIGFVDDENMYAIVYVPYLDNIYSVTILSKHAKKIIDYETTSEYFEYVSNSNINFKMSLFDNVIVEICICIMSKNKIHIKFIDPNPHVMYCNDENDNDNNIII